MRLAVCMEELKPIIASKLVCKHTPRLLEHPRRSIWGSHLHALFDIEFIEAPTSEDELEAIPKRVDYPLFVNMLTGGATPILSVDELAAFGYKIVVCPIESLMVCARAVLDLCAALNTEGRVDCVATRAMTFDSLKKLLDVERYTSLRDSFGG